MRSTRNTMRHFVPLMALLFAPQLALAVPSAAADPAARPSAVPSPKGDGKMMYPMRRTTQAERGAAAIRAQQRIKENELRGIKSGPNVAPVMKPGIKGAAAALLDLAIAQVGTYDLYASPNFALSALPTATCVTPQGVHTGVECQKDADCPGYLPPFFIGPFQYADGDTCTGPVVSGGIRKFVDGLGGICGASTWASPTALNCLPLATPDTTTFPGSDYYELGVKDYTKQFHTDLPPTTRVRGYYQKNMGGGPQQYLGPLILATTGRPTRVKFVNEIGTGAAGNLFVPMDGTLTGTGYGPGTATLSPAAAGKYTQNRIAVHLHGGNSPWISDGTQHQWTVPAGENTVYQKGVSVAYVPDMWFDASGNVIVACSNQTTCNVAGASTNPGPGALTYFWTNQQSGRLLWYHDHAYGITRLNAYIGQAAGYLIRTPADEDTLRLATVPGTLGTAQADWDLAHLIPMVIQEKTFVPPALQMQAQDPSWDYTAWGGEGNFWFPHVYTTNQWPGNPDLSGNNPFGRWDYGPWFWPVQSTLVNRDGTLRPLTVACTSAAAMTAANPAGNTVCPSTPNPSLVPETFLDTPMVNGTPYPTVTLKPEAYRLQILNGSQERNWNLSWFVADSTGTEVSMVPAVMHNSGSTDMPLCALNAPVNARTGLPDNCWPRAWPVDGRQGGVPDPRTAGPQWIQIGTEGGILPNTAYVVPQPVDFEYNRRNVIVLNVATRGLFLGPAERADVVVDLTGYLPGTKLILYNDGPAPVPASDPRQDFFTGGPDFTTSGGSPTPLPGYGPNTRTIMQIVIAGSSTQTAVNRPAIDAALPVIFERSQPALLVPQAAYNNVYNPVLAYTDTFLPISAQSLFFTPITKAQAPSSPLTLNLGYKALHELFDTDYGRMNSILAAEIPLTNWINQTTIPYTNYDPTTDYLTDGQPQIWKVTHNGVDTHTMHFHLVNVQLLNRVGWDGAIRPPDDNEMGWKDVVRFNPLEDAYIAIVPVRQTLNWPLADKWRPLDVDAPLGTSTQFTGIDVYGNPVAVTNTIENFGWEYVWHCHLLGHEENDMLRAEVFVVAPELPTGLTAVRGVGKATLNFTDTSLSALSFNVQRAENAGFTVGLVNLGPTVAPAVQPGPVTFTDPGPLPLATYYYRVQAAKTLTSVAMPGSSFSAASAWTAGVVATAVPQATLTPAALAFPNTSVGTNSAVQVITLTNTGSAPLTITSRSVTGTNATSFTRTAATTCGAGATLAAGAFCTITVRFNPVAPVGAKTANLTVVTSDPNAPSQNVPLTGTAVGNVGLATVTPASLSFNAQALNTTSAAQIITLRNTGLATLTLSNIAAAATNGGATWTRATTGGGNCLLTGTLAPNATCNIRVTFSPTATGLRTGTLTITSNSSGVPGTTTVVPLNGNAPAAAVSFTTIAPVSPVTFGNPATFTATGTGLGVGAVYRYRFTLDGGAPGAWSTIATFTLPGTTAAGIHIVRVDATTEGVAPFTVQATASTTYEVVNIAATGASFTSILPASPQLAGTPVTFTAAGSSSVVLPAAAYKYRFTLDAGVPGAWSSNFTYILPVTTLAGVHSVKVDVTTENTPVTAQASATAPFTIGAAGPATGVTFTSTTPPSPQVFGTPVTFTALGTGSAVGAVYKYRFTLDGGAPGVWSTTASYVMPGTTPGGVHTVKVDVTTEAVPATVQATASVPYTINWAPATNVIFSTIVPPTSPQFVGTAVTFTAAGSGSTAGAVYQYRFTLDGGTPGAWSTTAAYVMPGTTVAGGHAVKVDVSTEAVPATVQATTTSATYVINNQPATGVTLTPSAASPQTPGTAVIFTAVGSGGTGAYEYQFVNNGTPVQAWGAAATWTLPGTTPAGSFTISVDVRTAGGVASQANASVVYAIMTILPATGVTLTPSLPSPQVAGGTVTFTALGTGAGVGAPYQYQFWASPDGGTTWSMVQDYGVGVSWMMPPSSAIGTYLVAVYVRTTTAVMKDANTQIAYVLRGAPVTSVSVSPSSPSPQTAGAPVTFTASATGGTGTVQYQFWLFDGATWTMVRDYSATTTWALPGSAVVGSYVVAVYASTYPGAGMDANTQVVDVLRDTPATSVSVSPGSPSPHTAGTPVTFTASATGGTGTVQYQFWLFDGATWAMVRDYSATATWDLPGSTAVGNYLIAVYASTFPSTGKDANNQVGYQIQ